MVIFSQFYNSGSLFLLSIHPSTHPSTEGYSFTIYLCYYGLKPATVIQLYITDLVHVRVHHSPKTHTSGKLTTTVVTVSRQAILFLITNILMNLWDAGY